MAYPGFESTILFTISDELLAHAEKPSLPILQARMADRSLMLKPSELPHAYLPAMQKRMGSLAKMNVNEYNNPERKVR